MAFVDINPSYRAFLERQHLGSAEQFLALPGAIVGGHPDRNVARVRLGAGPDALGCFLKREHRVRWQDRLGNTWAGFGFVSRSVREARLLRALHRAGVGAPEWIAAGEDDSGRAFLLVRELEGVTELRTLLRTVAGSAPANQRRLARVIGTALAHMHDIGFTHPDLYSKHILIDPATEVVHFLDWQRGRQRPSIAWPERWRDLAALHATLAEAAVRDRLACLHAYLRATVPVRVPRRFRRDAVRAILRRAAQLERHRHIRELRQATAAADHQVIWLDGEALCVTPDAYAAWQEQAPAWLTDSRRLPALGRGLDRTVVSIPGAVEATLIRRRAAWSVASVWGWLWGKQPSAPEVRQAGLLFRLQRYGIETPRLLAFGQRHFPPWRTESFLLTESTGRNVHLTDWLAGQAPDELWSAQLKQRRTLLREAAMLLGRLHEAGCALAHDGRELPIVVQTCRDNAPAAALGAIESLFPQRSLSQRQQRRDLAALLERLAEAGCSRSDRMRVVRAYLGTDCRMPTAQSLGRAILRQAPHAHRPAPAAPDRPVAIWRAGE